MPFSIALTDQVSDHFREATQSAPAMLTIVDRKDGVEIPVAHLTPFSGVTAEQMKCLAIDMVDYFNSARPSRFFGEAGQELKYSPISEDAPWGKGVMFRLYSKDDAIPPTKGNSTEAALFKMLPSYEAMLQGKMNNDFEGFLAVVKAGNNKERRALVREPKSNAPFGAPSNSSL